MTIEREPDPLRRIPTKHTTALRAEIGPILRAARLKRGQSLEAVAQQTRISKRFLEALEENRFEQFPAVVYLRGFLKGYCEHLDVNFDEIWALLHAAVPDAAAAAATPPESSPATAASASSASGTASPTLRPSEIHAPVTSHVQAEAHPEAASHQGSGATGAIVLAVALAAGLGVYLFKDQAKTPTTPVQGAPAVLQPMPREVEPMLLVHFKNDAWLRVSVDGKIMFEGRVPRNAVQEWKPIGFVDFRTTEPSALEITLNGQPVTLAAPRPDGQYRVEVP